MRLLIIGLRRAEPLPAPGADPTLLKAANMATFASSQGWLLTNFEGLTRHRDRRFFMVSDDNCNAWQAILLVYFELWSATPPDTR